MTAKSGIAKQLSVIREQVALLQGWHLDSGALALSRCDTLVSLADRLREMVLDYVANPPKKIVRKIDAGAFSRN